MSAPPFPGTDLTTRRLVLGRPGPADVDAMLRVHSDPRACAHNPSDVLADRAEAEEIYRRWDAGWRTHGYGYRVVRRHGEPEVLGFCGIKPTVLSGLRALNLFYRLDPAHWGLGIAGEAARAVVAWSLRELPGLPLVARIRPANTASQRVALRAGLVRADHLDEIGSDGLDWIWAANLG
ncbi:GNAT family N-acetyltransferase [Kitasatospora sp. NE20-6]|uniref:GNAT family N-acetyltransferase n=1 Tax=Kitasatospora sp. NE20-6 TaxID=2859066 RepID=UPI0038B267FB